MLGADGKRLAFISNKEGGSHVWIADFNDAAGTVTGLHKQLTRFVVLTFARGIASNAPQDLLAAGRVDQAILSLQPKS